MPSFEEPLKCHHRSLFKTLLHVLAASEITEYQSIYYIARNAAAITQHAADFAGQQDADVAEKIS
jgi:hypothetical protein